jgi:hypothetical protein
VRCLPPFTASLTPVPRFPPRSFADFESEIWASYIDQKTDVQGVSTGWEVLDSVYRVSSGWWSRGRALHLRRGHCLAVFFRTPTPDVRALTSVPLHSFAPHTHTRQVVPGELTIVTGIPNSGKSEWIDALMVNLSQNEGWSFAMCSMEKKVRTLAGVRVGGRRGVRVKRTMCGPSGGTTLSPLMSAPRPLHALFSPRHSHCLLRMPTTSAGTRPCPATAGEAHGQALF